MHSFALLQLMWKWNAPASSKCDLPAKGSVFLLVYEVCCACLHHSCQRRLGSSSLHTHMLHQGGAHALYFCLLSKYCATWASGHVFCSQRGSVPVTVPSAWTPAEWGENASLNFRVYSFSLLKFMFSPILYLFWACFLFYHITLSPWKIIISIFSLVVFCLYMRLESEGAFETTSLDVIEPNCFIVFREQVPTLWQGWSYYLDI